MSTLPAAPHVRWAYILSEFVKATSPSRGIGCSASVLLDADGGRLPEGNIWSIGSLKGPCGIPIW